MRQDATSPARGTLTRVVSVLALAAALGPVTVAAPAGKPLHIYFIDVEGGQSTLIVAPSGQSLLVDTGWPDFDGRDANRIVAAARLAHLKRIDDLIITHFHADHVGGVPQLVARIPVGTFIDHGASVEHGKDADALWAAYQTAAAKGLHRAVKPGDPIALKGVNVTVLTANGDHIENPLEGAGQPNAYCAGAEREDDDPSENARSVGILLTFGKFRFVDLGDLTWNKELDLMCPGNRVGTVSVFLTSHHGMAISNSKPLVWALHPEVAIMNNGAKKGGEPAAWERVKGSPGLDDLWQLHYSEAGGNDHNVAKKYIANLKEKCQGHYIELAAEPDGSFTVKNSRNGFARTYQPRN